MKSIEKLEIKPSAILNGGLGLFALKDFKANKIITRYGGVLSSEDSGSGYGVIVRSKPLLYLDGSSTQSGMGRWANDCQRLNSRNRECKRNNARFSWNPRKKVLWVKSIVPIKKGEEIFVGYGRGYWK